MLLRRRRRSGAVLVESALVYPVVLMVVFGIIMLGIGVYHYQRCTHIAREATRYASVHGSRYASETGNPPVAPDDGNWSGGTGQSSVLYSGSIQPQLIGMQTSKFSYAVSWNSSNSQFHTTTVTDATTGLPTVVNVSNTVTVTVTYNWDTGIFGTIPVSSTSTVAMSY